MKHFFVVLAGISFTAHIHAGCQVRDVINHTRDCSVSIGRSVAKPMRRGRKNARVTTVEETVGERLQFRVERKIKPAGGVCKEYLIRVKKEDAGEATISLYRREACGQAEDAPGLVLLSTITDVPEAACQIDLHVHDVYTVKLRIFTPIAKKDDAITRTAA